MKYIVQLSRIFVGVLFIISGLIKLNDPLGFSYKLQEYFSVDVLNMPFLEPYALAISVFVVVFEVVLGVFLLIGYKPKFTIWSLLAMIVFFTFLTFYSAYFDKVKDCGCFGDALKLTPWESFTKDLVLLFFVLILFFGIKHIKPLFNQLGLTVVALLSFIASLWFGYHVLMHLPSKDFRPYKIGANIQEGMIVPEDAPKPVIEYQWKFNVNGDEQIITTDGAYPTVEAGEYVSVETKIIDEGYEAPIKDFSIEDNGEDLTNHFLEQDNVIAVVMYSIENSEKEGLRKLKAVTENAIKNGYQVIGLSASGDEMKQQFKNEYNLNFDTYLCDEKVLKTIVRSNPGIIEMHKGTVKQKLHWNDFEDLQLETLTTAKPDLNFELKKELDDILALDQGVRQLYFADSKEEKDALALKLGLPVKENAEDYMQVWNQVDSTNLVKVEKIFKDYGYPGKTLVGNKTNEAAWYVIQHSPKIEKYLPIIKEAASKNELPKRLVAMMEDRYLMGKGKMQIYGTQGTTLNQNSNPLDVIWPIEDFENVNKRRAEVGYDSTVEEYAKRLFGDDFVFKNYTLKEIKNIEKEHPWIIEILKDIN